MRYRGLDLEDLDVIKRVHRRDLVNSVAVDVGANLGLFSLALAKGGFHRVYACEPLPDTYKRLVKNVGLNPSLATRIVPCKVGVGEEDKVVDFIFNSSSPGQSKIALASRVPESQIKVKCELMTLPSLFSRHGVQHANFLKLDVEGFESSVLRGALPLLQAGKVEFIYAEIIPKALEDAGSSLSEFAQLIEAAAMVPVVINPGAAHGFEHVSLSAALEQAGTRRNVLFQSRTFQSR